ncbi:MAG: trypsin-like peptidase domain-containing protein [Clostridia bacterium]|nr:trypsin-like peptidase domain-containing protein [Clostridia bacterium]
MKKLCKSILSVSLALTTVGSVTALAACDDESISAYEIAVENGFVGDEQAWLNSLHGADGEDGADLNINDIYEAAKQQGYEGSFMQFLQEYLQLDVRENNDTEMIAQNVMSVVSVFCGFQKQTTYQNKYPPFNESSATMVTVSGGSGVFLELNKNAGNAYIVTNYHVLYQSSAYTDSESGISQDIYVYPYGARVGFTTGDTNGDGYKDSEMGDTTGDGIRATFVGGAMDYDIAILKVEGSEYLKNCQAIEAKIGDSDDLEVGEKVYAIGNANGEGIAVTSGNVSVDSEYITMSALDGRDENRDGIVDGVSYRVLRTDAAINHGNSGGALFDAQGELIGITNAKNVEDETDNMGYALPITQVERLVENIMDNGGVLKRAMLGVLPKLNASSAVFENGTLKVVEEVVITDITNGAAADGKLKYGDIVKSISINGGEAKTITRSFQINDLLLTVRKGDTLRMKVVRESVEMDVEIVYNKDSYFVEYN